MPGDLAPTPRSFLRPLPTARRSPRVRPPCSPGFGNAPVISGNNVAFVAAYNAGFGAGIFTGTVLSVSGGNSLYLYQNGTLDDVAAVGEPLFSSTIAALGSSLSGLDGNHLTYSYTLANGVTGIGTFASQRFCRQPRRSIQRTFSWHLPVKRTLQDQRSATRIASTRSPDDGGPTGIVNR